MTWAFLAIVGAVAVGAWIYWALLTWWIGDDELFPYTSDAPSDGRILHVGDRVITEQELQALAGMQHDHEAYVRQSIMALSLPPESRAQLARDMANYRKDRKLRAVSGGTPTAPRTPAA